MVSTKEYQKAYREAHREQIRAKRQALLEKKRAIHQAKRIADHEARPKREELMKYEYGHHAMHSKPKKITNAEKYAENIAKWLDIAEGRAKK